MLYKHQKSTNSGAFSDENLISFAKEAGLDVDKFRESFESGKYEGVVQKDFQDAQEAGIPGTPSFNVNGQILVGPQSAEAFEKAIEQEKQKAS